MSQESSLLAIGSIVEVDLNRVSDRIPGNLVKVLAGNSYGEVKDYKMTDGQGIGFVLKLTDGTYQWFFDHEIKSLGIEGSLPRKQDSIQQSYNNSIQASSDSTNRFLPNPSQEEQALTFKEVLYLFNPINFLGWLIYSLGDVF